MSRACRQYDFDLALVNFMLRESSGVAFVDKEGNPGAPTVLHRFHLPSYYRRSWQRPLKTRFGMKVVERPVRLMSLTSFAEKVHAVPLLHSVGKVVDGQKETVFGWYGGCWTSV